jgi:hypothetical protein
MNGKFIINTMLIRYFIRSRRKPQLPPTLFKLILRTPECAKLLNLECPWCGRKFRTCRQLRQHLIVHKYTTTEARSCVFHFNQLVNYLTDTFYKVIPLIYSNNRKYYVRGYNWYFKTLDEAVEAALNVINNSQHKWIH